MKGKVLVVLSILFSLNTLLAVPFGTLGNIDSPDGFVMPANQIAVNFASYLRDGEIEDGSDSADYEFHYVAQAKYGLFNRAELGLVYTGDEVFYANFKFQLVQESRLYPGVTIGVDNLFSKVGRDATDIDDDDYADWEDIPGATHYERNSFYLAASKSWALRDVLLLGDMQLYVTVGLGVNRFVGQSDLAKDLSGLFGSIEYYPTSLFPKNNFSIFAEQSAASINAGAQYSWKNLTFQYSVLEIEESFKDDGPDNIKMALNVQYNFTHWADSRTKDRSVFQAEPDKIKIQQQKYDSATLKESNINTNDLLKQIRAIREERRKAQDELNGLIQELEELE